MLIRLSAATFLISLAAPKPSSNGMETSKIPSRASSVPLPRRLLSHWWPLAPEYYDQPIPGVSEYLFLRFRDRLRSKLEKPSVDSPSTGLTIDKHVRFSKYRGRTNAILTTKKSPDLAARALRSLTTETAITETFTANSGRRESP